jgi:hypothetical protein
VSPYRGSSRSRFTAARSGARSPSHPAGYRRRLRRLAAHAWQISWRCTPSLGIGLSFSGLATVPILRESLVLDQGLLTDARLNDIAISQASPGPLGMYVVLVRYFVSGVPGALTGVLASGPIPWQSSLTLPNL